MLSRPVGLGALALLLSAEAMRTKAGLFRGAPFVVEWLAAVALFAVSLLGMIVSTAYTVLLSDGLEIMGSGGAVFSAVIFVIGVLLLVYARRMSARGVLA
jgi:hypothetical protein